MAQRVAIARALASAPSLLVMDEPFSALDELTREVLRDVLLDVWETSAATVLWVTHSVAEAVYLSDRIVVLSPRPGRVVADVEVGLARPRRPDMAREPTWAAVEDRVRAALRAGRAHP
jgi:NitT/TauT family transport system ATP-binding protein